MNYSLDELDEGDTLMQTATRNFDPTSTPGLSAEARKAVNAAFDAMSTWRTETLNNSEKNVAQVIEKMAAAARALGWPEQIVDATRAQMQSITKMQIQVMDHMMDIWEEQIKSPNPSAMLSKLQSLSSFWAGRQLAERRCLPYVCIQRNLPSLRAIRRTMAKSLGKRDWRLGDSRQIKIGIPHCKKAALPP
jgi:hypothetical protein